jgi:hypothetical protein
MTRVEVKFQDLTIDTKVAPARPMQRACKRQPSNRAVIKNVLIATNFDANRADQHKAVSRSMSATALCHLSSTPTAMPWRWVHVHVFDARDAFLRVVSQSSCTAASISPSRRHGFQLCMLRALAGRHLPCGHQAGAEAAVPDPARGQWHHQAGTRSTWKHCVVHPRCTDVDMVC